MYSDKDENDCVGQTSSKILSTYPKISNFVSSKKLHIHKSIQNKSANLLSQASTFSTVRENG